MGERAAVCCVTMYNVRVCCACRTYGLLDVADACRYRHFHDMQVPLMWPMPAVTVTSSHPRLHANALDVADARRNRHFITIT